MRGQEGLVLVRGTTALGGVLWLKRQANRPKSDKFAVDGLDPTRLGQRVIRIATEPVKSSVVVGQHGCERVGVGGGFDVQVQAFQAETLSQTIVKLPLQVERLSDVQHRDVVSILVGVDVVRVVEGPDFIQHQRRRVVALSARRHGQQQRGCEKQRRQSEGPSHETSSPFVGNKIIPCAMGHCRHHKSSSVM